MDRTNSQRHSAIFDHFQKSVRNVGQAIGALPGANVTVAQIIAHAVGQVWLEKQVRRVARSHLDAALKLEESLPALWSRGDKAAVAEIYDLAAALLTLFDVDGLTEAIAVLRNDYRTASAQLAIASRMRRLGCHDLALEPSTLDGRNADLSFALDGDRYTVECYAPRHARPQEGTYALEPGINAIFEHFRGATVEVRVAPKRELKSRDLPSILRAVKKLETDANHSEQECDAATCTVRAIEPRNGLATEDSAEILRGHYPDVAWVVQESRARLSSFDQLAQGVEAEMTTNSILVVERVPGVRTSAGEILERLAKKIAQKARQARSLDGGHRLVVVRSGLVDSNFDLEGNNGQRLLRELASRLNAPCHIMLATLGWSRNERHHFYGQFFSLRGDSRPLTRLVDRLRDLELQSDPLFEAGFGVPHWPLLRDVPPYSGKW